MKRFRAAWAAFMQPDPKPIRVVVDATEMVAAIRRHQRRQGRPPTV